MAEHPITDIRPGPPASTGPNEKPVVTPNHTPGHSTYSNGNTTTTNSDPVNDNQVPSQRNEEVHSRLDGLDETIPTTPPPPPSQPRALSHRHQPASRLQRLLHWFHLISLDLIAMLLLLGLTGVIKKWCPMYSRTSRLFPIYYNNHTNQWQGPAEISYPEYDGHSKYPGFAIPIIILSFVLPMAAAGILVLVGAFVRDGWDHTAAVLGLNKGLVLMSFIQIVVKRFIGEFRPNFIYHCRPDFSKLGASNPSTKEPFSIAVSGQVFASVSICANLGDAVVLAMESFPSGHTSEAFTAAVFVTLYLNGKLKPFSDYHTSFWKMFVVVMPMIAAIFVASSVFIDRNHHAHDIILSIPLGLLVGLLAYRSHFASLFDYRTNHLYLPWSGSHRSLQAQIPPGLNKTECVRPNDFRHPRNLTAVQWPRKRMMHGAVSGEQESGVTGLGVDGAGDATDREMARSGIEQLRLAPIFKARSWIWRRKRDERDDAGAREVETVDPAIAAARSSFAGPAVEGAGVRRGAGGDRRSVGGIV